MDENENTQTPEEGSDSEKPKDTEQQKPDSGKGGQAETEKVKQEYSKKLEDLQKELDEIRKSKMTEDEVKQYEIKKQEQEAKQRQQELDKKQAELTERENRYFALEAVSNLSLGIKGDLMNQIVDLVMSDTQDSIKSNVKAFESVVNQLVKAKVDETFKANGRQPGSGNSGGSDKETSIGVEIGKRRAAADKSASDILKHYI